VEEKIKIEKKPVKSPALAGILSVIFPGAGALYNGNYLKGIIMIIVFAGLVSIQGRGGQPFVALLLAGFYIFQIIDAINEAKSTRILTETTTAGASSPAKTGGDNEVAAASGSISWGIILILLGSLFLLANFDIISYESFIDYWPLILVGLGLKLVVDHFSTKKS
jgi:TM2 domain-containing membrane protein YozV